MMVNSVLQILTVDCVEVELENTALASDRAVVSTQPQDNFDSRLEYIHMGTFSLQQQLLTLTLTQAPGYPPPPTRLWE